MPAARATQPLLIAGPRARERNSARALWLAIGLAACAGPPGAPPFPDAPALRPGELRVRLVFDAEADLDLYVTGPGQETLYFANTPAGGGELDADRRCGDPEPRVEMASFPAAPAGRYRVGVDHAARCDAYRSPAAYRVVLEAPGHREERSGVLELGRREPRVLEVELAR